MYTAIENATALPPRLLWTPHPVTAWTPAPRRQRWRCPPKLLLGVNLNATRTDHQVTVNPGETLLLYTNGLIERPRYDLDEGTADLLTRLHGTHAQPLDQLCDQLLDGITRRIDDDVAVLAVRLSRITPASR